ncbi:MAG: hypothetical protein LAO04_02185 [Acidobacteriia bacterium]|nr:hypothetical protein [Terriglobia bacterium]
MKTNGPSDGVREFSMTWAENEVVEMQALSRIEVRQGQREEKDVKNEGRSGNLYENKGWRESSAGRSGYIDENKLVSR